MLRDVSVEEVVEFALACERQLLARSGIHCGHSAGFSRRWLLAKNFESERAYDPTAARQRYSESSL